MEYDFKLLEPEPQATNTNKPLEVLIVSSPALSRTWCLPRRFAENVAVQASYTSWASSLHDSSWSEMVKLVCCIVLAVKLYNVWRTFSSLKENVWNLLHFGQLISVYSIPYSVILSYFRGDRHGFASQFASRKRGARSQVSTGMVGEQNRTWMHESGAGYKDLQTSWRHGWHALFIGPPLCCAELIQESLPTALAGLSTCTTVCTSWI